MEDRKAQIIKAFKATLVDFGYTSLLSERVEKAIKLALANEHQGNVIAMFIYDWLEDEFADLKPEVQQLFK